LIYLKKKNIIFLKPRKVAGTSFEICLSAFADDNDIITPITTEDEKTRTELGFAGPRNYRLTLVEMNARDIYKFLLSRRCPKKFYNHISARDARRALGADTFDSARKISIVRNPFDMLVSMFHWRKWNSGEDLEFAEWVRRNPGFLNINEEQYFINDNIVIDKFIRYEKLVDDIVKLETEIQELGGICSLMKSVNAKGEIRPRDRQVSDYYENNSDLVTAVRFFNASLIGRFGYDVR